MTTHTRTNGRSRRERTTQNTRRGNTGINSIQLVERTEVLTMGREQGLTLFSGSMALTMTGTGLRTRELKQGLAVCIANALILTGVGRETIEMRKLEQQVDQMTGWTVQSVRERNMKPNLVYSQTDITDRRRTDDIVDFVTEITHGVLLGMMAESQMNRKTVRQAVRTILRRSGGMLSSRFLRTLNIQGMILWQRSVERRIEQETLFSYDFQLETETDQMRGPATTPTHERQRELAGRHVDN